RHRWAYSLGGAPPFRAGVPRVRCELVTIREDDEVKRHAIVLRRDIVVRIMELAQSQLPALPRPQAPAYGKHVLELEMHPQIPSCEFRGGDCGKPYPGFDEIRSPAPR